MGVNSPLDKKKKRNLAVSQGDTYSVALNEMQEEDVHASTESGDYFISIACEAAEGMYEYNEQGELAWMIPKPEENLHVEVVVQDKDDKRFLPELTVTCVLQDEERQDVVELHIPFIWHPFLFHYGSNTTIPKAGKYFAKITIKKPSFHRHDETYGKRYGHDVTVTLGPVKATPGRKEHGEE